MVQCMGISWFAKQQAIIVNIILNNGKTFNAHIIHVIILREKGEWGERVDRQIARERNYT